MANRELLQQRFVQPGRVKIEGVEFDVISDGRFIEKDKKVVIYKISNSSLVVKEI